MSIDSDRCFRTKSMLAASDNTTGCVAASKPSGRVTSSFGIDLTICVVWSNEYLMKLVWYPGCTKSNGGNAAMPPCMPIMACAPSMDGCIMPFMPGATPGPPTALPPMRAAAPGPAPAPRPDFLPPAEEPPAPRPGDDGPPLPPLRPEPPDDDPPFWPPNMAAAPGPYAPGANDMPAGPNGMPPVPENAAPGGGMNPECMDMKGE